MITSISRILAQQIVDTVSDVCGMNVNFINPEGQIFASSDRDRIGTYHELGRRAAESGETIEAASDDQFQGTKKGINIPIFHHHSLIAVVGITGDPEEARRYAHLAERITHLLIREQELNETHRTKEDKKHYILQSIMSGSFENHDYLEACLQEFHIDPAVPYRMVLLSVNARYNLLNISLLEQHARSLFDSLEEPLFSYLYPNRFAGLLSDKHFSERHFLLEKFATEHHELLYTAIGSAASFYHLTDSWEHALIAERILLRANSSHTDGLLCYDDLTLEILFSSLSESQRRFFYKKTLAPLTAEEREFLKIYYEEDMSLKNTSERLFLHKNTVQQRLNRIYEKTGLNPRVFRDAVPLYLAGEMEASDEVEAIT